MLLSDVKILNVTGMNVSVALAVMPDVKFYATHPQVLSFLGCLK